MPRRSKTTTELNSENSEDNLIIFTFPSNRLIGQMSPIINEAHSLYRFLKDTWEIDPYLRRFECELTIRFPSKESYPTIISCKQYRCQYYIKIEKYQQYQKIVEANYIHNHLKMNERYLWGRYLEAFETQQPLSQYLGIMMGKYGSPNIEYFKKKIRWYYDEQKMYVKGIEDDKERQKMHLNKELMFDYLVNKLHLSREEHIETEKQKLKNTLKRNAKIVYETHSATGNIELIFYSSEAMQDNFRKWGKSVYIAEPREKFVQNVPNEIKQQLGSYLFCGSDQYMNIVVFGIGVISGSGESKLRVIHKKKNLMRKFMENMPNMEKCQSILVREQHEDLVYVLEALKVENNPTFKYILKYKMQQPEHAKETESVSPYNYERAGFVAELAFLKNYEQEESESQEPREAEEQSQEFQAPMQLRSFDKKKTIDRNQEYVSYSEAIRMQASMIYPTINQLCTTLNKTIYASALDYMLEFVCESEDQMHMFRHEFLHNRKYYCLLESYGPQITVPDQFFSECYTQNQEDIAFYASHQHSTDMVDEQSDNETHEKIVETIIRQNRKMGSNEDIGKSRCSKQDGGAQFDQTSKFIGFNLFIDFELWIHTVYKKYASTISKQKKESSVSKEVLTASILPTISCRKEELNILSNLISDMFRIYVYVFSENNSVFALPANCTHNIGFNCYIGCQDAIDWGGSEGGEEDRKGRACQDENQSDKPLHARRAEVFGKYGIANDKDIRSNSDYYSSLLNCNKKPQSEQPEADEGSEPNENEHVISEDSVFISEPSRIIKKLPFYNLMRIYLSEPAQQYLFAYELLQMLPLNCQEVTKEKNTFPAFFCNAKDYRQARGDRETERMFFVGNSSENYTVLMKPRNSEKESGKDDWKTLNTTLATLADIAFGKDKATASWSCECEFSAYMGLGCRHIYKAMLFNDYSLINSFDSFWMDFRNEKNVIGRSEQRKRKKDDAFTQKKFEINMKKAQEHKSVRVVRKSELPVILNSKILAYFQKEE